MKYTNLQAAFFVCFVPVLLLSVVALFTGCSKKFKMVPPIVYDVPTVAKVAKEEPKVKEMLPDPVIEAGITNPPRIPVEATVYFDLDKSDLNHISQDVLNKVLYDLKGCTKPISIVGGCCPLGTAEYNNDLGHRRANRVVSFLNAHGAEDITLLASTIGETQLVTEDPSQYALNRRVEIKELP